MHATQKYKKILSGKRLNDTEIDNGPHLPSTAWKTWHLGVVSRCRQSHSENLQYMAPTRRATFTTSAQTARRGVRPHTRARARAHACAHTAYVLLWRRDNERQRRPTWPRQPEIIRFTRWLPVLLSLRGRSSHSVVFFWSRRNGMKKIHWLISAGGSST